MEHITCSYCPFNTLSKALNWMLYPFAALFLEMLATLYKFQNLSSRIEPNYSFFR